MYQVFDIYFRHSCQSIDTRPAKMTLIAPSETEVRKKFRKTHPNADIVEIRIRK